ncbi:hypothetical protein JMJ77_0004332 [Colletotrichum scovillei]|uniref:Uncharacterized protein n=1 Tax=Colletotrichum scovillei TaxID=1209932 RepID=A0A9P7QX86_9PEZI|nr:hypothetical protein JMJ77_0004332 [Colletotrichum scovillei]KAG7049584.1 hypothetical protein JMJ78_0013565 [Colletotrichum scovillei]KAG7064326.1 hypothetical protein JMJ76_0007371 [Colletotrichum scovillei]
MWVAEDSRIARSPFPSCSTNSPSSHRSNDEGRKERRHLTVHSVHRLNSASSTFFSFRHSMIRITHYNFQTTLPHYPHYLKLVATCYAYTWHACVVCDSIQGRQVDRNASKIWRFPISRLRNSPCKSTDQPLNHFVSMAATSTRRYSMSLNELCMLV